MSRVAAVKSPARTGNATIAEAAAYLGVKPKTLRNWRAMGHGPRWVGHGHGVRYPWREIEAWNTARIRP